jgi:dinuclear metal center YbgI/SA1388 family protein
MVQLDELVSHCDALLEVAKFHDYAPNGLQVEGRTEIAKLVTGVTASQALIDAAIVAGADALLVHHGFFWKGESAVVTGLKRRRLGALIENNISLIAYHLPLDAHPELGNNAQLARLLGLTVEGRFGRDGGDALAMHGALPRPMSVPEFALYLCDALGREPLHLPGSGDEIVRVGWCSGAAQGYIEAAAGLGVQAFVSGEVSEYTTHYARESGVHYFAAGHHATERYGVQALGGYLAQQFGLQHEFIDIANPV